MLIESYRLKSDNSDEQSTLRVHEDRCSFYECPIFIRMKTASNKSYIVPSIHLGLSHTGFKDLVVQVSRKLRCVEAMTTRNRSVTLCIFVPIYL
jgi:hypothetical protein